MEDICFLQVQIYFQPSGNYKQQISSTTANKKK